MDPEDVHVLIAGACECVITWQGGIKVADGIKDANEQTLNRDMVVGYPVGPMEPQGSSSTREHRSALEFSALTRHCVFHPRLRGCSGFGSSRAPPAPGAQRLSGLGKVAGPDVPVRATGHLPTAGRPGDGGGMAANRSAWLGRARSPSSGPERRRAAGGGGGPSPRRG